MRAGRRRLAVVALDVYGGHAGTPRGFDVTPPVSHASAARQVEVEPLRGIQQQARPRLAARAAVAVVVRAYADLVERHEAAQPFVHLVDLGAGLLAPGDIWLIGHHDEDEAGPPQFGARVGDARQDPELFQ